MKRALIFFALMIAFSISGMTQALKSVSILGDSYSTFEGHVKPSDNAIWYWKKPHLEHTDVSSVTQTWWHLFIKENGYKLCQNNSFSGSTICNTGYNKEDYSDRSFISRMNNLGSPDIILILGATNDSWSGAPIGEYKYSDWTKEELYQFRPAMAYMLHDMKERYPNVEIYFILNNELKPEINESVEAICKHYDIDCVILHDIHKISGHPSIKGMRQIADQLKKFIDKKK